MLCSLHLEDLDTFLPGVPVQFTRVVQLFQQRQQDVRRRTIPAAPGFVLKMLGIRNAENACHDHDFKAPTCWLIADIRSPCQLVKLDAGCNALFSL